VANRLARVNTACQKAPLGYVTCKITDNRARYVKKLPVLDPVPHIEFFWTGVMTLNMVARRGFGPKHEWEKKLRKKFEE
jgi:hypothetical protein